MCSIFGLAGFGKDKDYRQRLLEEIGVGGESRGKEATGIASINNEGQLYLQKENKPSSLFDWTKLMKEDIAFQGHTRFSTGSPINWQNNHPFYTGLEDYAFTVTHNGMISNHFSLKKEKNLDDKGVQCDSYVVNLLLENVMYMQKKDRLDIDIVKEVAELLEGSYSIVIMDTEGRIFFFRNTNPCKYIHTDEGLVWASTKNMLLDAEIILQKNIGGKITETDKGKVYEYSVAENDFINIKEFTISYSYGNYNWQDYSGYNNSVSKKTKTKKAKKQDKKDKDFVWHDNISGNYYYFKNDDEFVDFLRGDENAGELISDNEILQTLEDRYKGKDKEDKKQVECPICKQKSNADEFLTMDNIGYDEIKKHSADIHQEWFNCPKCQQLLCYDELEYGYSYVEKGRW